MIRKLGLIIFLSLVFYSPSVNSTGDEDKIFLNLRSKTVCSGRLDKCFPVAIGKPSHPTPTNVGPYYITDIRLNGFDWQNPFTGRIYKAGTHNLGNIWITFHQDTVTGNVYGFHKTPEPGKALSAQQSHGCVRMNYTGIKTFGNSVKFWDQVYINKDA